MEWGAPNENFYALILCIRKDISIDKALCQMKLKQRQQRKKLAWKIPDEDVRKIRILYLDQGNTMEYISKIYGCSASTLCRFMKKHGIEVRSQGRRVTG